MNPVRRRRLLWVLALVVAAAIAATLVAMALQRNVAYLYTPNEVLSGKAGVNVSSGDARFRLGGMVAAGSFQRASGSMEAHFKVDDGDAMLPVVYTGILPDLFREKQAVVATGRLGRQHEGGLDDKKLIQAAGIPLLQGRGFAATAKDGERRHGYDRHGDDTAGGVQAVVGVGERSERGTQVR